MGDKPYQCFLHWEQPQWARPVDYRQIPWPWSGISLLFAFICVRIIYTRIVGAMQWILLIKRPRMDLHIQDMFLIITCLFQFDNVPLSVKWDNKIHRNIFFNGFLCYGIYLVLCPSSCSEISSAGNSSDFCFESSILLGHKLWGNNCLMHECLITSARVYIMSSFSLLPKYSCKQN